MKCDWVIGSRALVLLSLLLATVVAGCAETREVYYDAWEKIGYAKRDRLVDNVKSARDAQQDAKQQFASALDQFKSVVNFKGGDLEALYDKLNDSYKRSDSRAAAVKSKIQSVKNVGEALFTEWQGEIAQMSDDPSLQSQSKALYDKTHEHYDELVTHMDTAAATMDPVLRKFKDRVLFIKANLNAEAIASLQGTDVELGGDIDNLIKEMQDSINEADKFISQVQTK
jgi:Skp family chaperone for outer membrane proteins